MEKLHALIFPIYFFVPIAYAAVLHNHAFELQYIRNYVFLHFIVPTFPLQITTPLSFSLSSPTDRGNDTDPLSLLAFKDQITNDPLGKLSSWNESLHFCEWSGVTCGRKHKRVVKLELQSSQLAGSLSPHIGNLSFLRILYLYNNSLARAIPPEIGRLFRLRNLVLENNSFSGEIPVNISRCSNLEELWLPGNNLTGKLPEELGSLSKLQILAVQANNLVGEIPPSFGNLSSLTLISGYGNHFQGGIPDSIRQLIKLEEFYFGGNNLSGTIPPSIYNLSSLTVFTVETNQLHGSLPANLGNTLPNLKIFSIAMNQFTGLIPETLSNATNFSDVVLAANFLTGKVPSLASLPNLRLLLLQENYLGNEEDDDMSFLYHLANNTNLEVLVLNDNNFGGILPEIVSNFSTKLRILSVEGNLIRGSIPTEIGNLINLQGLALGDNQMTGIIPSSIGKLQNLFGLALGANKFLGSLPSSLGNITSLLIIDIVENNLQGSIPSSLGNCRNLLQLALAQNNFSGFVPKEVMDISSLSISLDLSENQLIGSLPSEVGRLANLGILDVSKNKLSGQIPSSLGNCLSMESLDLGGNFFQGSIPHSLSSLKAITKLNVSHNNLTGQVPMFLAEFELLTSLDLSFNNFEGNVPVLGVFKNASAISISGNKRLCGGILQLNLSRCTFHESKNSKSSSKLILVFAIPCGFLAIILVISSTFFYCHRKTKGHHASEASWEISFQRITYRELVEATDGFSSSNLIGTGAFGSVYKGILASSGVVVAVKVFNLLRKGASRSFMRECKTLINIRHRNLVKVLTACSSIDFQGNDFKALIYEFLVNGSIEEWLHPIRTHDEAREPRHLDLVQRLNIAIDVTNALDYLHLHCETPIVHCDLKPSNILLDGDMIAHVGDFGLAKFCLHDSSQSCLDQSLSSVGVKGTIGYMAPEYGIGGEVSIYGDVYSYGILLLEMFTGKRPTDGLFEEGLSLRNFVKMALPDRVMEVVDSKILRAVEETRDDSPHRMKKIVESLISIMEVGIACSAELPRERMDISKAATELNRIRSVLLRTRRTRSSDCEMKVAVLSIQEETLEPTKLLLFF